MSNQTFIKKDRISFAVDSNEILSIVPINNETFYFGSSATNSNVGVVLSNQYIYADGTYLSNLPIAITQSVLNSTITGLGTFAYISSFTGGITGTQLVSTSVGLGSIGYISSSQLTSTVTGLTTSGLSLNQLSTIQSSITSSIVGLGTLGYISSSQLISTVQGISNITISVNQLSSLSTIQSTITSSIVGLGSLGYISSSQLRSTVSGLGNIYISTFNGSTTFLSSAQGFFSSLNVNTLTVGSGNGFIDMTFVRAILFSSIQTNTSLLYASSLTGDGSQIFNLPAVSSLSLESTVRGLGATGYISSSQLVSTVGGLQNALYVSSIDSKLNSFWSTLNIPASSFNILGLQANNTSSGYILYSNVQFPPYTKGLYKIYQKVIMSKTVGASTIQGNIHYSQGGFPSTTSLVDGYFGLPPITLDSASTFTTVMTTAAISTITTRNITYYDSTRADYQASLYTGNLVVEYIPQFGDRPDVGFNVGF